MKNKTLLIISLLMIAFLIGTSYTPDKRGLHASSTSAISYDTLGVPTEGCFVRPSRMGASGRVCAHGETPARSKKTCAIIISS